ncbi:hypothetical protein DIS17_05765 [Levilactobacillus brevis]|uniref:UvrD-like helicase ATP-binding domain-containing protein n=1 Tax=Levilactobacillus brevis TaxID=1580 RepID=A0AAJ5FH21_LEVBR|nr:UvrD-helicase domain-containing protein [Levilactobacillus brevis]AWP47388.1 hypothetical protein CCS05_10890 [Levilactobacillus brevis]TOZ04463.1 hypothetical protein DIS17_05765 [Levilactobacillus brevis]
MADAITQADNVQIIDMPAGSGKTYDISKRVNNFCEQAPTAKVLCITYTNRAVHELEKNIANAYISTIHTFINDLMSPLFTERKIVTCYLNTFKSEIEKTCTDSIKAQRYSERMEEKLTYESVQHNLEKDGLTYGETNYTSWQYGRLGHNDLLKFCTIVMKKYPKLKLKIIRRFKMIIIDEYQDTDEDIIKMFWGISQNENVQLCLYGDSMQQIYREYSPDFNEKLLTCRESGRAITNYRSNQTIIDILNKLYNDKNRIQEANSNSLISKSDYTPRIIIIDKDKVEAKIKRLMSENRKSLILYLFNAHRYKHIGAWELFDAYRGIDKYGFNSSVQVKDILLNTNEEDNPDKLMALMIWMYKEQKIWKENKFGVVYSAIRSNASLRMPITLEHLKDKEKFYKIWQEIFNQLNVSPMTIGDLYDFMAQKEVLSEDIIDELDINKELYEDVFKVPFDEVQKLETMLEDPTVSTQHGVKGESHDSIIFVAEDGNKGVFVYMREFLKLISTSNISLQKFYSFMRSYVKMLDETNSDKMKANSEYGKERAREIYDQFREEPLFKALYEEDYLSYLSKQNKGNLKKIMKASKVKRTLTAYRLFYVGCSRARRNLTIIVTSDLISGFKTEFEKKFKKIGFEIISERV